jgi:hypothetical protein
LLPQGPAHLPQGVFKPSHKKVSLDMSDISCDWPKSTWPTCPTPPSKRLRMSDCPEAGGKQLLSAEKMAAVTLFPAHEGWHGDEEDRQGGMSSVLGPIGWPCLCCLGPEKCKLQKNWSKENAEQGEWGNRHQAEPGVTLARIGQASWSFRWMRSPFQAFINSNGPPQPHLVPHW